MKVWEMTLDEYRRSLKGKQIEHHYYNRDGQIKINHMNEVSWAVQLDKPVTDRVLKSNDYTKQPNSENIKSKEGIK